MKLERTTGLEVPPKIRGFITGVIATPLENIEEPLKSFVWDFDTGDLRHWVDLFNHFDTLFEKYIKSRRDFLLEDDFLEHDPPLPREGVLQILCVVRIILENCINKDVYNPYEDHLSSMLASTDVDVVESCLQTLAAFLKKSTGKYVVKDGSLNSKLFALSQGWGGKDEGLGLVVCAIKDGLDSVAEELGPTLHFQFYVENDGLQIIHLPNVNTYQKCDRELMQKLIKEYKVPHSLRFSLLTRLRFARAFSCFAKRIRYICIRLHAFIVFFQARVGNDDDSSTNWTQPPGLTDTFFNTEPEFINELVTLLSYEDSAPEEVRILCLISLVAICQDRTRLPAVLSAVTSGGILLSLVQKAIDAVLNKRSEWFVSFAEALISLVAVLVSSPSGCSAMREAGFMPILLPLIKDTDPQHLHLVKTTLQVLEAFMHSSIPAGCLFRDLGGLDDTIFRLNVEVSHVENCSKQQGTSSDQDSIQPLYSEALVSYHRWSLIEALLRALSKGIYVTVSTSHVCDCLCVIFRKADFFGGRVFSLAAVVMSKLIHQDPTCFPLLEAAGLPSAFLGAIMDGVDAIMCIPHCLDALCLNNNGLQAVKDGNALRCFVKIFTTRTYLRVLTSDTLSSLSSGLDELVRHASSLRGHWVDVLIEILKAIKKLGYEQSGKNESSESFLPDCVKNVARLLEVVLQNSDTCCIFVEKKGVEAILKLFTLPLMPLSVSVGQSLAVAFKRFSPHHCASLSRALCSFMRQHLILTNKLLISLEGMRLAEVEDDKRTCVLRCLSSLEGILSVSCSLAKGTTTFVSELGTSDADLLSHLGATFREIIWQLCTDCCSKLLVKQSVNSHTDVRYINPVSVQNSSHPSTEAIQTTSPYDLNRKSPETLVYDNLINLSSAFRCFFIAIVKGFSSPNPQTAETGSLSADSKSIGTALAIFFLEALRFRGYATSDYRSLKCRYFGWVVNHMADAMTFDSTRRSCYTVMINYFYVQGTFKELLNTFQAMGQLLSTLPYSVDHESSEGRKLSHSPPWLFNTLDNYCYILEFFVNSTNLLHSANMSRAHLVIQPVAVGLFPVPRDPKVFVRMLQSQVLDVILPIWNHPVFPCCTPRFITGIVSLFNCVYSGASDARLSHGAGSGGARLSHEATISAIVDMGFTRRRAEEALRHVETNSVEMATEWLFSHPEVEDGELAQALALSLGSSSETHKTDYSDNLADSQTGIDDILAVIMKLFRSGYSISVPLMNLLITLCTRDKGEERPKVIPYLIQQLKLCSLETLEGISVLCTISSTLPSLLRDFTAREIAAENGLVCVAIDLLIDLKARKSRDEIPVSKCIAALLSILYNLLYSRPKSFSAGDEETNNVFGKVFGNSTSYLTIEEGKRVINVVCDMMKQNVLRAVMYAVFLLCSRLTKTHTLALSFLENGGMVALFSIPRTSSFLAYDTVASAIVRHLVEDPLTLQTAMESEIQQTLTAGRILTRTFLTSVAPLISRDPEIFMKAAKAVCQLESSGGRTFVVLSKEIGVENKSEGGPVNLTWVIHHMLGIILKYPSLNPEEECSKSANAMEIDESATSKGKSFICPERSAEISKVTFLLKLLSDILLMYVHAVGIVLKRDSEICQLRGSNIVHHVIHQILHFSVDKKFESDELRAKLSEKGSGFLVVLCGCSSEACRRVVNELVKTVRSFSNSVSNSSKGSLLPDKKVLAFVNLLCSILSKNSSSGFSPDIAKGMINGGMIPCLSNILQVLDLDHPDAPKVVNIIIQVLEGLTRAANALEQLPPSDMSNKKKPVSATNRSDTQMATTEVSQTTELNLNSDHDVTQQLPQQTFEDQGDDRSDLNEPAVQEMRAEMEETETIQNSDHDGEDDDDVDVDGEDDDVDGDDDSEDDDDDDGEDDDDDVDGDDEDVEDRSGLIDMATEPREGLNDRPLLGVTATGPLGFDRRHQQNRITHLTIHNADGNGLQHPLVSRPSQSGSMWSSGGNPSHNSETVVFGDRYGPLVGENRSTDNGRSQAGNQAAESRWTDNGQSLAGNQAAAIAQAVEQQFMSQLQRQPHNSASQISPSDAPLAGDNQRVAEDLQARGLSLRVMNASSNGQDNLEIGEGDGSVNEQELQHDIFSATDNVPNFGDPLSSGVVREVSSSSSEQNTRVAQDNNSQDDQSDETGATNVAPPSGNGIDPTFLEALPEDLRAEVLASQQVQSAPAPTRSPAVDDDIDPEFLAALPPNIQEEVLAQQRAQRVVQQAQGQPVDMDNASIIATFPADLRQEVLLTSSEEVLSALPSPVVAEAQMLRDRAMSHYHAHSSFGSNQRLSNQRNGLGFDRQTVIQRGVGITIGRKVKEVKGEPLLDTDALKAFIRLLRLEKPLGEGLLQRLLLNLCAHSYTREILVYLLLDMIKPETKGRVGRLAKINSQRLYGCQSNVVYGRSQLIDGLPPLVLSRILVSLTYLAINHSCVTDILFYFDTSRFLDSLNTRYHDKKNDKGKEKVVDGCEMMHPSGLSIESDVPILLFIKLLNHGIFPRSIAHLEQVSGLLLVIVCNAALKLDRHSNKDSSLDIFLKLPQADLHHFCSLLGHKGLSDKVYTRTGKVLKILATIASSHRKFFIVELSNSAHNLIGSAIHELITLRDTKMLSLSAGSMAGDSVLRILQTLNYLTELDKEHVTMWRLNVSLEPLWQELSECISVTESQMGSGSFSSVTLNANVTEHAYRSLLSSPGTQRLLPFIEAFLILCEKLQKNTYLQDNAYATASEVKQLTGSSSQSGADSQKKTNGAVTFARFVEKHRRLLNAFVRQDPTLLEKSLSMLLKAPRLMDFDNKRYYFQSKFIQQRVAGSLQINVRRAYILEDSYNQLRLRSSQDMKRRLYVRFQGEEGIDAGGLTREWYQLLSRVIFDKGALLFTTVGNNATFQPNPNSVFQNEHLSYFKFIGRVVSKALFDGQLLDVYFTRSFYKHILGVKVTYHDIEAVDPDYYKNLKWMLENDVSDIPGLTFSMDADEEKHILYEKTKVTDYELKPGGRNIRVTEETKHEYVDLVAEHKLTNAIRPQINSFLEGFNELIPRETISIFNDKELELLINGLPEIDFDDLKANTKYTGYTVSSCVIMWFWEVVKAFNKEDRARLLQFVTGTSKVPLEGFKALQGLSGPQKFQIHKDYGAPDRLPSAHTCFNQLDLPEYMSKEQLQKRLLLAIHEASEGFGFA